MGLPLIHSMSTNTMREPSRAGKGKIFINAILALITPNRLIKACKPYSCTVELIMDIVVIGPPILPLMPKAPVRSCPIVSNINPIS